MKSRNNLSRSIAAAAVALLLSWAGTALAQDTMEITLNGEATQVGVGMTLDELVHTISGNLSEIEISHNGAQVDEDDLEDVVLHEGDRVEIVEDYDRGTSRLSIAGGIGLIDVDEKGGLDDDDETYFMAAVRIPLNRTDRRDARLRGYLEPELGYWESDTGEDFLIGLNWIGAWPFETGELFFGLGAGIHSLDFQPRVLGGDADDDEVLGLNIHMGVDKYLSDSWSLFGVGRFDVIDDLGDSIETKLYVGLRWHLSPREDG